MAREHVSKTTPLACNVFDGYTKAFAGLLLVQLLEQVQQNVILSKRALDYLH